MTLVFDVPSRNTLPPQAALTPKQFAFLLYLALRRTDTSDGWVDCAELVARVPWWLGEKAESAGKEVARFDSYPWFKKIQWDQVTKGPYRLIPTAGFQPDRDAADLYIADPPMPPRLRKKAPPRRQRLTPIELQAYDMLIQHGVFLVPVIDLILQRLGDPTRIQDEEHRLVALKILATLDKNRGRRPQARHHAQRGLTLARKLGRKDEIAYLLDQLGGIEMMSGQPAESRAAFDEEIALLKAWGTPRARFHLVGAYRGLAGLLRLTGDLDGAAAALAESVAAAEASRNDEGARLAALESYRIDAASGQPTVGTDGLASLPTEHLIGRIMALNAEAEAHVRKGERLEAERALRLVFREATRLGYQNEVDKAKMMAEALGIALKTL